MLKKSGIGAINFSVAPRRGGGDTAHIGWYVPIAIVNGLAGGGSSAKFPQGTGPVYMGLI